MRWRVYLSLGGCPFRGIGGRSTRIAGVGEGMPIAPVHTMPTLVPSMVPSASVFLQGHYNHPANNKLYLGPNLSHMSNKGHIGGMSAVPKAPKPPEKPLMPYMRYSRKVWDEVKADNLNLKLWQIGKIIGQMWRELPASDKQQFVEEYEMEKLEHLDLMKSYHNSSAYQSYLHAKSRAEAMEASAESLGSEKDDAYMSIEPVDDSVDDMESGFSVKHVAAARFQRNHRLINDILGETVHVPNVRAVVTKHRLNILKNQVQSLQLHQKKLEAELKHIEEVHESKKRKWKEQANSYGKEMKILCEMSPQEYYKEWKQKQQLQAEQAQLQRQQAAEAAAKAASEARTPSTEKEDIGEKVEEQKKIEEGVDPSATSDNISQNTEDISSEEMPSVTDDPAPSTAEEKMDVDVSGNSKDDKTEMVARNEISESSEVTENTSTEQNEEKTVVDADESAGNEENSSKENENNDSEKLETKEDPSPSEKESTDADVSNTSPEEEEEEGGEEGEEEEEEESGDN